MNIHANRETSGFGRQMRYWRTSRKLSQLELASLANTTPRYISFLETGRSRPGRDLILRIAEALRLPIREVNLLMFSAGFAPEYEQYEFDGEAIKPYRAAIEAILDKHDPFPACALDCVGNILMANKAFAAFTPGTAHLSPEDRIEMFFNPDGDIRSLFENWEEAAWQVYDRQKSELAASNNSRLAAQVQRIGDLLSGVERPGHADAANPIVFTPRMKFGDTVVSTFATIMRFENATEVTLSEVRVELIFPTDTSSRQFFENLFQSSSAVPYSGIG
ncbi:MAG: helix-turn-helix domain-containing protein [Roseibium sp.]